MNADHVASAYCQQNINVFILQFVRHQTSVALTDHCFTRLIFNLNDYIVKLCFNILRIVNAVILLTYCVAY